jgi:hypothetical protein
VKEYLFNICMLSAFGTYLSQFCGFIALRTRFSSLNRDFRSPLGISGAVFGGIVFSIAAVGVIAFQDDNQVALISFICLLAMQSAYYFFYAKRFEKFSPEESKILFVAHVMQRKYKYSSLSNVHQVYFVYTTSAPLLLWLYDICTGCCASANRFDSIARRITQVGSTLFLEVPMTTHTRWETVWATSSISVITEQPQRVQAYGMIVPWWSSLVGATTVWVMIPLSWMHL